MVLEDWFTDETTRSYRTFNLPLMRLRLFYVVREEHATTEIGGGRRRRGEKTRQREREKERERERE